MFKKSLFVVVFATGLFITGCDKDSDSGVQTGSSVDVSKILELPYSSLTPAEQKVKLENESIELVEYGNALKSSSAIEAFQNLGRLLGENSVSFGSEKIDGVEKIYQYADFYAVFKWNASKKDWDKTESGSELKFEFPAKKTASSNNAVFSVKAESSGVAVTNTYEDWDSDLRKYIEKTETFYLPKSSTGILTINGKEEGKIEMSAEYQGSNQAPRKASQSMTLSDGYVFTGNFEKAAENSISAKLEFKGKVLFEAAAKSGIKIDEIIDLLVEDDEISNNLYNKANAYIKILDNVVLVYDIDIENYVKETNALDEIDKKRNDLWNKWPAYQNHYQEIGKLEKEWSDKFAEISNKYQTVILASIEDGAKIASLSVKSEKDGEYSNYYEWNGSEWREGYYDNQQNAWIYPEYTKKYDYYHTVSYLKFNDNTNVDIETYFSDGFTEFVKKWESFVNSFDR